MDRLTDYRNGVCVYTGPGCKYPETGEIPAEMDVGSVREALQRLAEYEGTGLEPKQAKIIYGLLAEVAEDRNCHFDFVTQCVLSAGPELAAQKGRQEGMDSAEEERLYRAALALWGAEAQTLMVFEEMAELQKELCKAARGKDNREQIAEEIADVEIMLEQMKILHVCAGAVKDYRESKLRRLAIRCGADMEPKEGAVQR